MKNKLTTLFLAILFLFITFYTAHSGINDIKKSINVNKITSVDESPSNITPMKSIKTLKKSNKHNEIINTKQLEKEIYNYYDYSSIFLPQAKTLKIKIKDKIKTILRPNTIKLPNYLLKAIKPQQIKASSFKMPVRIDETSQNKENYNPYDLIPPPEFPPTQDNPDTVEAEGFLIINKIFSHLASLPPPSPFMDEAEINKILVACYTVLEAFSNYEHICALTKFYIAECYRRQRFYNFGWGVMFDSFYKNDLLYKIYEQNLKEYENSENPYCKYVCDKIKYRLEEVNNKLLKLEKEIPDLKETITYHKGELEKLKDIVYDSYPNPEVDTTPDSSYSSILLNYEKIMVTYYNMGKKGNDPEVIALKNEFLVPLQFSC